MVRSFKNGWGIMARFGLGSVRLHPYLLKSRKGGQLEITECVSAPLGAFVDKSDIIDESPKVVLDFRCTKSLDILIEKLETLREMMVDQNDITR